MDESEVNKTGYVYLFQNGNNLNEIKIGCSQNPIERRNQLHNTSTARKMFICSIWFVNDMRLAEKAAHELMAGHRVSDKREIFNLIPDPYIGFEVPHQTEGEELAECYIQSVTEKIEECWVYMGINYHVKNIHSLMENQRFNEAMKDK